MHLDVHASQPHGYNERGWHQVQERVRRLVEAGATQTREVNEPKGRCIVLQDPEGNEFCVQ